MSEEKPEAIFGEFKGSKVITIFVNNNENFRFTFGLGKAKAIKSYLEEINKFIEDNDKPPDES